MRIIKNVTFLTLEFDFGNKGNIHANVFVEIDNDGEKQQIEQKIQLHETSFLDFIPQEKVVEYTQVGDNFSSFIQPLRNLIALKVASDLGFEVADNDYSVIKPLRDNVKNLEVSQEDQDEIIMKLLIGGAQNE